MASQPCSRGRIWSRECVVLANPAAAAVDQGTVDAIYDWASRHAETTRVEWTQAPGHASAIVRAHSAADLIVVVGGDGTLHDVVQGLVDADGIRKVVCPLPVGSGNSTARNLFGDLDWRHILDLLDEPGACRLREVDLIRLLEPATTAVLGASTGFLAQVLVTARDVDPALRGIQRYFAAAAEVLQAMPAQRARVYVDGELLREASTASIAIGGGRFRARSFQFLPNSLLDDGWLDVCVIDALPPDRVAELIPLLPTGRHLGRPEVRYDRGRTIVVESTDGAPLVAEFDGSVWDDAGARLTAQIVPRALLALSVADGPWTA